MSKKIDILLIVVFSVVAFVGGFSLNEMVDAVSTKENAAIGIYHSSNWNNKEATLVLNEDGTCNYPGGKEGSWDSVDGAIKISIPVYKLVDNGGAIQESEEIEKYSYHTAVLVDGGIILHEHFFEKK